MTPDDEVSFNDEGWDSRAYLVNEGEVVFKFPRSDQVRERYEHEVAALRLMEAMDLPVRTPRMRWQGPDLSYFGYEGIAGIPLAALLDTCDAPTRRRIGTALGQFLRLLHDAALDGASRITVEDEVVSYQEKYRLATPALDAAFSPGEREVIAAFYEQELPVELRNPGGELRLGHGDLGPWNVVITSTGEVGVIDFGDVAHQDPARDFAAPFGDSTVIDAALEAYGAGELLRRKVALRVEAFSVLELPFYLGKKDEAGTRACLELLQKGLFEPVG